MYITDYEANVDTAKLNQMEVVMVVTNYVW